MNYETGAFLYNGKKNILWGAGKKGVDMLFSLAIIGIHIEMFCDSDIRKQGGQLYNKPVVSPEIIIKENHNYNIIITIEDVDWIKEIEYSLLSHNIEKYITWQDIGEIVSPIHIYKNHINGLIYDSYKKKLLIYGDAKKSETQGLKQLLNMLDVEIAYLLDDIDTEYEWMGSVVKPVYDLIYEKEDFKVIVTFNKIREIHKLDDIGLIINRDYCIYDKYTKNIPRTYILDVHLGYNFYGYEDRKDIPGFVELGMDHGYKIALLGGSTTDGTLYPFKSWGEILFEKFKQNGYKVKIINGGCGGYSSSQELLKLIRDIVPMRPDFVIDYTGVNDLLRGVDGHPFVSLYHKELFEAISSHARLSDNVGSLNMRNAEYTLGVVNNRPLWEQFIDNIRMMHSICHAFGIEYYAFLQPHLTSKKEKLSIYEREIIENEPRITKKYMDAMEEFYCYVKQVGKNYIEDMTALFDEEENVYFDRCHVTEEGNDRIAQYIYNYLTETGSIKLQDLHKR